MKFPRTPLVAASEYGKFKDKINPYKWLLRNANDKKHISLNSQFTVVFNGVICFSVRYCDNHC